MFQFNNVRRYVFVLQIDRTLISMFCTWSVTLWKIVSHDPPPTPRKLLPLNPPSPLEFPMIFHGGGGGGVWIFSGTTHCCCDSSTIFVLLVAIFQLSYVAVSRPFACWSFTLTWPLLLVLIFLAGTPL